MRSLSLSLHLSFASLFPFIFIPLSVSLAPSLISVQVCQLTPHPSLPVSAVCVDMCACF